MTFPKKREVGDALNPAEPVVVVEPLAERGRLSVGLPPFEVNVAVAVMAPVALGVTVIVRGWALPGAKVIGN